MKFIILPFLALGIVLSGIAEITYECEGSEMFPTFYGSPFVFKVKSLGSSMEFFYSISGLVANIIIWSVILFLIRKLILTVIKNSGNRKCITGVYKGVTVILIAFTFLIVIFHLSMIGHGFEKGRNYWYIDLDQEAKDWGMTCEGKLRIL